MVPLSVMIARTETALPAFPLLHHNLLSTEVEPDHIAADVTDGRAPAATTSDKHEDTP